MQHLSFKFVRLLLLIILTGSAWFVAKPYDAKVGDVYYNLNSDGTASVARNYGAYSKLTYIYVPTSITYGNETYTVTEIASNALEDAGSLMGISLPETLNKIGRGAFIGCRNLKEVNVSGAITTIEPYAFEKCESLTSFPLSEGLTEIPDGLFDGCSSLALDKKFPLR